jgi:hypothetical protein
MKTQKIAIIFTTIATIPSSNFGMEKQNEEPLQLLIKQVHLRNSYDKKYHKLNKILAKNVKDNYNTIDLSQQYEMLKTCIAFCNNEWLGLCLDRYNFNPNRYHKNISLLHYAIQQKNYSALWDIINANADLVPLYDSGASFAEEPLLETPLDFAVRLRDTPGNGYDTSMRYQECVRIMVQAIKQKYNSIIFNKNHCGLSKHLIDVQRPCLECIKELSMELRWHNVSYVTYSATSDYSSTATEADSSSCPDSDEK